MSVPRILQGLLNSSFRVEVHTYLYTVENPGVLVHSYSGRDYTSELSQGQSIMPATASPWGGAALAISGSMLISLITLRLPELVSICRTAAHSLQAAALFSACPTATLRATILIAVVALLLSLPVLAGRRKRWGMLLGAALSALATLCLCDGPLLWRPHTTGPSPTLSPAGRTYLITGANSGLGLELASQLVAGDATVLLACRSLARCDEAAAVIRATALARSERHTDDGTSVGDARVVPSPLDLADLDAVDAFARTVRRSHTSLDGLVLNAGFCSGRADGRPAQTEQGIELSLGTMHVAHAHLTELLMPLLERRRHASVGASRVVTVASEAATVASPFDDSLWHGDGEGDLRGELCHPAAQGLRTPYRLLNLIFDTLPNQVFSAVGASGFPCPYLRAKLANVLFSRYLADRRPSLGKRRVLSTAVGPGFVRTNIFAGTGSSGIALLAVEASAAIAMRSARRARLPAPPPYPRGDHGFLAIERRLNAPHPPVFAPSHPHSALLESHRPPHSHCPFRGPSPCRHPPIAHHPLLTRPKPPPRASVARYLRSWRDE